MHSLRLYDIDTKSLKGRVLYRHEGGFTQNAALSAFSVSEAVFFIPRAFGTTSVRINAISAYDESCTAINAVWTEVDGDQDVYVASIDLSIGLYFYDLVLETPFGEIYGYKSGEHLVFDKSSKGNKFQLTISDFKHSAPTDFFGGIIYHIFVDRFARHGEPYAKPGTVIADYSDGIPEYPAYPGAPLKNNTFYGGSLYGVIDKLDYIASLGANIIYLSPIFESPSNHKYDTSDYLTIDEAFGGNDALKALIEAAHSKGIKIVLDGVFNHTGSDSIYFNRYSTYDSLGAYQSKESPYYNWYDFKNHPDEYTCWWDIEILPRINVRNRDCSDFFVGENGIIKKYADMGIDGFRLDVVDELDDSFIEKIKSSLGKSNDKTILYGEVWEDASNKIAYSTRKRYYLGSELDGVMNYPIRRGIIDYLTEQNIDTLKYALTEVTRNAPERIMHAQMNLLGTHDTERILTVLAADKTEGLSNSELSKKRLTKAQRALGISRLKLAYAILTTLPGIPAIFYGDEAGLEGYGDPFNRMPYPWGQEDKDILDFYRKIGIIRKENDVYSQGEFILNHLDKDILIFTRKNDNIAIITAVNNSQKPISLTFSENAKAQIVPQSKKEFSLKPHSAEIFKAKVGDILMVDFREV